VRVTERGEIPQLPAKAGIRWGKWIHSPSFQPKQAGGGICTASSQDSRRGLGDFTQLPAKAGRGGGGFAYSPAANGKRKENAQQIPQLPAKTAGVQLQQEGGGKLQSQPQLIWQCSRRFPANSCSECGSNTGRRFPATIPATAHLAM
jgi:hypothetical protein